MAFDKKLMSKMTFSLTEGKVGVMWAYGLATDNLATITASGFFDDWFDQVTKDDLLYIVASDANDLRVFSNATGVKPVTVAAFITAGDIADGSVTQVKIAPNSLDATVAKNVAANNVIGGEELLFRIDTAGGATANTDIVMTHKVQILDVWVVNKAAGTASDTILVNNTSADITDVIDISGAIHTVARTAEVNLVASIIAATGTLRVTETDGGGSDSPATAVFCTAVRVA